MSSCGANVTEHTHTHSLSLSLSLTHTGILISELICLCVPAACVPRVDHSRVSYSLRLRRRVSLIFGLGRSRDALLDSVRSAPNLLLLRRTAASAPTAEPFIRDVAVN